MSKHKHNYTQYSDKKRNTEVKMDSVPEVTNNAVVQEAPKVEQPKPQISTPKVMNETVETKLLPETVEGVVVGCAKLNVRAEANLFADVVCVLDASSEIEIDVNKSNNDWFYICTATGIEGYCMRRFVEAHL